MKRITGFILFTLSLVYLTSCDKIEGNHFQPLCATDTAYTFPIDNTSNVYRVLLEDYTGHTCGNCPTAANIIYNTLVPTYGGNLVVIGVHAGFFAIPCPPASRPPASPVGSYSEDLNTAAGTAWYNFFNIYSNPLGMVNRIGYPNNEIITSTNWNTTIAGAIGNMAQVKIRVHNIYDPSTRRLQTFTETKFINPLSDNYNLNVVLTEDSVIAWQEDYADSIPNIPNYAERHVLRGSLNGNFGEQINTSTPTNAGTIFLKSYCTTLSSGWNAAQCHVVVFLFDASTYQILNVTEAPVIE